MGEPVTTGLLVAGLVASVAGQAIQTVGAIQGAEARERAQREGRAIQGASQRNEANVARRRALRQRRILAARIEQSAENTGVAASSGEIGAVGSLGTSLAVNIAAGGGRQKAVDAISAQNQTVAEANVRQAQFGALGSLVTAAGGFTTKVASSGLFERANVPDLFDFGATGTEVDSR